MGKIYKNDNQILLQQLIEIYKPNNYDWLSYQITKSNILTLHHVIKVADGGVLIPNNSALLTKKTHRNLHICENRDKVLYVEINDFFKEIILYQKPLNYYLEQQSKEYKKALTRTLYKY